MNTLYSKIDSRRIPIYSIQDAARYLRIPVSTIRSWTIGHNYPVKSGSNFFAPIIEISPSKPYLLSFTNLIEIHVLRAIRQHHKIQLNRVRDVLDFIDEMFVLVSQNLSGADMANIFVTAIPTMEKFITHNLAPFIAKVERDGKVKA